MYATYIRFESGVCCAKQLGDAVVDLDYFCASNPSPKEEGGCLFVTVGPAAVDALSRLLLDDRRAVLASGPSGILLGIIGPMCRMGAALNLERSGRGVTGEDPVEIGSMEVGYTPAVWP